MKDYHFEKDDSRFDKTIRLDDINEEMKKLENAVEEDELGDKDAFLDAFESERFERPPHGGGRPPHDEEPFFNKKTIALVAVAAVVAVIVFFAIARGFFGSGFKNDGADDASAASPVLIQGVLSGGELVIYDITEGVQKSVSMTETTTVANERGNTVTDYLPAMGDIAFIELSEDGRSIASISFAGIKSVEATGLEADTEKRSLIGEDLEFYYDENALFVYNGDEISPKELDTCDLLSLTGIDETVWVVEVLEYHGYIEITNTDNITNGKFKLDDEEEVPLEEVEKIAVKEGTHTVEVTGDNIEKRTDSILVETGETYEYDLSKAQEKVGVLIINANVTDYRLYINGTLVDSAVPSVLPLGEYDVVILKNGYAQWSQHVELNTDTVTLQANLERDVQVGALVVSSNAEGAQVYLDGREVGVAPIELSLPYGTYQIGVEKNGYRDFSTTVNINSPTTHISAELDEE